MSVLNPLTGALSIKSMSLSSLWSYPSLCDSLLHSLPSLLGIFHPLHEFIPLIPLFTWRWPLGRTISRLVLAPQWLTRYLVAVNQTESKLGSSMNGRSRVFATKLYNVYLLRNDQWWWGAGGDQQKCFFVDCFCQREVQSSPGQHQPIQTVIQPIIWSMVTAWGTFCAGCACCIQFHCTGSILLTIVCKANSLTETLTFHSTWIWQIWMK